MTDRTDAAHGKIVSIAKEGDIAIVTVDNPPVNALSQRLRQALWDAVEAVDADPAVRGAVLRCAGRTFIAGADVAEFGKPPVGPHLPDLVARIEAAQTPWCAAIHGSALGGGFEVAQGCRFRVATPDAMIGLPEVTLGIVPGAGGTVRTPRQIDVAAAVDLVTGGKPKRARAAQSLGLIDAVIEGDLTQGARDFLEDAICHPLPQPLCDRTPPTPEPGFWDKARSDVAARARGAEAPLRALDCLRHAVENGFDDAMAFERETFLDLRGSPQSAALRHVFFAERAAPRPPELKGVAPLPLRRIGVVGGGTMGAGIAAALRDANLPVTLIERDAAVLDRGIANLRGIYEGSVRRGRMTEADAKARIDGVTGITDYAMLADADLVIEAVFEDMEVKRGCFAELARVCRPDAVLATNTSYLDPTDIAAGLEAPDRFIGLHFFSPAHIMKLLEIVPLPTTSHAVLATAFALARGLGKIPVRAGICDGFIGNRILKVTRTQGERLVLAGASPARVDAAMHAFGQPMGPFEVQDLSGLDIAQAQRKAARERGETPFAPVAERLNALGRLGRKTGGGWYDYVEGDRNPHPSDAVAAVIAEAAADHPAAAPAPQDDAGLADAIVLPMVNEAAAILSEGVALRAADIDLVKIHGYGFPRWRGGPLHHASARGLMDVVSKLEELAAKGLAQAPNDALRTAAREGGFAVLEKARKAD